MSLVILAAVVSLLAPPALALVALLLAKREDIPRVVEALSGWWRR
jgi:hypothetical protein